MNPSDDRFSSSPDCTRVAVSLTHTRRPLCEQIAEAQAAGADMVELRVDRLGVEPVRELLRRPQPLETILTVRQRDEGGDWDGSLDDKLEILCDLAAQGVDFVDLEWTLWRRSANARARMGALCGRDSADASAGLPKLILSHHDLRAAPDDLDGLVREVRASGADVVKVVSTARDATDALRMVELVRRHSSDGPIIGLAMGEGGLASRILCRTAGAFLTFAAPRAGEGSAPGQPTIAVLKSDYRWDTLDRDTRVFGLLGHPVAHSRGACVHNAAMAADGINGVYVPLLVAPGYDDFVRFMQGIADMPLPVSGLSVTTPHKVHALRWLKSAGGLLSPIAVRCGAVNTLVRREGSWQGDNTDAPAAVAALRAARVIRESGFNGVAVDVLGAGGVARAVVAALAEAGCRVTIWNRSPDAAARLAGEFGCRVGAWAGRQECGARVLINCTTVGMTPDEGNTPFPAEDLARFEAVFDTVYAPSATQLLRDARRAGVETIRGVEMFIAQAERQYRAWHGREAPRDSMRGAIGV